ncbi:MAG: NusG domain II-containing protein [Blautia sp.]|nr:NusG domain II-containing protein [Blautia sp.]MCM1200599.1 NusG domain II-containing protein [Bacteroides fragilis]
MTKADIVLLAVILTAALALLFLFQNGRDPGSHAVLSFDGKALMRIPLSRTEPRHCLVLWDASLSEEPVIKTLSQKEWEEEMEALSAEYGTWEYNLFSCGNGEIRMLQSSCPDLICVRHKAISGAGENIICLPHALVIEIAGARESGLDGVVY